MPHEQVPLSQRIHDRLRERLREGGYPSGAPLVEAALAREFDVSRTPVREALSRLLAEGLIQGDGGGYRAPSLTLPEIREIFDIRLRLEPGAFRDLVAELTEAEAADLAARLRTAIGIVPARAAHQAFRRAWLDRLANGRLAALLHHFDDQAEQVRAVTLGSAAAIAAGRTHAAAAARATGRRDPAGAEAAMRGYLDRALSIYEAAEAARDPSPTGGSDR